MNENHLVGRKHVRPLIVFLLVCVILGLFEVGRGLALVDDQITTASMVLKDLDPSLYPRDPTLADGRYRIYVPALRTILGLATRLTSGDVEAGHRVMVPLVLFIFLCSFYSLLFAFTHDVAMSALVSLLAALQRPIFPATYWGVWGISALPIKLLADDVIIVIWQVTSSILSAS